MTYLFSLISTIPGLFWSKFQILYCFVHKYFRIYFLNIKIYKITTAILIIPPNFCNFLISNIQNFLIVSWIFFHGYLAQIRTQIKPKRRKVVVPLKCLLIDRYLFPFIVQSFFSWKIFFSRKQVIYPLEFLNLESYWL